MEGNTVSGFMEIDEAMDEKIKENLKCYSDSLKKGKGCSDPAMEKWITKNTAQYMIGRPLKANAKLELGQWYTIFRTLSRREVLEIPCELSFSVSCSPILNSPSLRIWDTTLRSSSRTDSVDKQDTGTCHNRGWQTAAVSNPRANGVVSRCALWGFEAGCEDHSCSANKRIGRTTFRSERHSHVILVSEFGVRERSSANRARQHGHGTSTYDHTISAGRTTSSFVSSSNQECSWTWVNCTTALHFGGFTIRHHGYNNVTHRSLRDNLRTHYCHGRWSVRACVGLCTECAT